MTILQTEGYAVEIAGKHQRPYDRYEYHGKPLFVSFWHQIRAIKRTSPASLLEIGVGSGFTADYLRKRGVNVTTVDCDKDLQPDVVADVRGLPFSDGEFDVVACFEVLEHLPFDMFGSALAEIRRVAQRRVIISLPDAGYSVYMGIRAPAMQPRHWLLPLTWLLMLRRQKATPDVGFWNEVSGHHWEINVRGFPLSRIVLEIEAVGLEVVRTWRVPEYAYHRFFELAIDA